MDEERNEKDMGYCPIGRIFQDLQKLSGKGSKFFEHLNNSHVEFLKAVRALVDERIENLESKGAPEEEKRSTKIEVE